MSCIVTQFAQERALEFAAFAPGSYERIRVNLINRRVLKIIVTNAVCS